MGSPLDIARTLAYTVVFLPEAVLCIMGCLLLWSFWKKQFLFRSLISCWAILTLIYVGPVGNTLVQSLESYAFQIKPDNLPENFEGFVLLGGCFSLANHITQDKRPTYNMAASRLLEFALLARQHSDKPILITGTEGETFHMKNDLEQLGIEAKRIILESQSQNTQDNAFNSYNAIKPEGTWVLVTSAFHMRRAYGLFCAAGWNVIPWPVGFFIDSHSANRLSHFCRTCAWHVGMKEYLGLIGQKIIRFW